jgi:hypothetical protein
MKNTIAWLVGYFLASMRNTIAWLVGYFLASMRNTIAWLVGYFLTTFWYQLTDKSCRNLEGP